MITKIRAFVLTALLAAITCPSYAEVHFKARAWQEGEGATEAASMEFESYIAGESAAIYFGKSGNPMIKEGNRLVTKDAAKTIYLVDDEKKTYWLMDVQAWVNMANDITKAMGPMLKIKIENASVETLETKPGGRIANLDTTYYKTRRSYDIAIKVAGFGQKQHVESVRETWVAKEKMPDAVGVWIQQDPPDLGDSGLGELIRIEMENQRGFPVKTIDEQVTTNKKGKQTTIRNISQVDLFERVRVKPERFEIGSDYQLVASPIPGLEGLTPPADGEEEEPKEEGKKGRFKKLLKRGGGE